MTENGSKAKERRQQSKTNPLSFVFRYLSFIFRLLPTIPGRSAPALKEVDPRAGYDQWALTYDADEPANPVLCAERTALHRSLPSLKGQAVLDLACGTGRYALRAAQAGAWLTVGLDLSAGMLRQAGRRAMSDHTPVVLIQADQSRLPLASRTFDVVIHAMGMGYAPDVRPVAAELGRVLHPGGIAFVSDLHPQGVQRGWRRTFSRYEGALRREITLKSYPHRMPDYRAAFDGAGLAMIKVSEPRIDESLQPLLAAADGLAQLEQYRHHPLVVIFELRRKG